MRKLSLGLGIAFAAMLFSAQAAAVGTSADTLISNTATANFNINGNPAASVSDTVDFRVDEVIDVTVATVGGQVTVQPGDTGEVLAFDVTNTGNGTELFDLTVDTVIAGGFDPVFVDMFIDDGDGIFEPGTDDTAFDPNTDQLSVNADQTLRVFVRTNIPLLADDAGAVDGALGEVNLLADSATAGASGALPGTVLSNLGTGTGIDAVVGTSSATANDTHAYVISSVTVVVNKTIANIADTLTGNSGAPGSGLEGQLIPGATVTYNIEVIVSGTGTAQSLIITDTIPAVVAGEGIAYIQGSVTLDSVGQTDAADVTDDTQVNFVVPAEQTGSGTAPGGVTVQVDLGDVTGGTTHDIQLDVEIQ